jgi:hypothetical protein
MATQPLDHCTQCGDPILPDEPYLDQFMVGEHAPIHQECVDLWMEDEDRGNFWFDYVMPGCRDCGNFRAATKSLCPVCHVFLCQACTDESAAYGHEGRCRSCSLEVCDECQRL